MSNSDLTYFLNKRNSVTVVTLTGTITETNYIVFDAIITELSTSSTNYVILNFGGIIDFEKETSSPLVFFQKTIREMGCALVVCDLHTDLKKRVIDGGIMRQGEIVKDLMAALQFVLNDSKRNQT